MYCQGKDHLAKDCPTRAHLPKHGADAAHENRYFSVMFWPGLSCILLNLRVQMGEAAV